MEALMNLLMEIDDEIAWTKENKLIDKHILDSLTVITMVSELEDTFDVEIRAEEMIPENFNSVEAMWKMICRLQGK